MIFYEVIVIKLLTLNTHSLVEENYDKKLLEFVEVIAKQVPDIIALQEVNQTCTKEPLNMKELSGFHICRESVSVKRDNHMYNVVRLLKERGITYEWTWLGMKKGYGKYDEGIGMLSRSRILETDTFCISTIDDYDNWKTRKIVGIRTAQNPDTWFYSMHMGWWEDAEESFEMQWERVRRHMKERGKVWLLGDFNNPAQVAGEGYQMIKDAGWKDTYLLADIRDEGITVGKVIDGWRETITDITGMRIDQVWCNYSVKIQSSKVIFNGCNGPIVSDHYGVLVET